MRLFVSIDFPQEILDYLAFIQENIKSEKLIEGGFVDPKLLHLTLQFIGEVSEGQSTQIKEMLNKIVIKQFDLCLEPLGFFEKHRHPAILWIDMQGILLVELAKQVHNFLTPLVELEDREFVSHVTLARIKKVYDIQKFMEWIEDFKVEPRCFSVQEFTLKQSVVGKEGREHRVIARYHLEK
jgi:2'-5' RNA ligase